MEIERKSKHIVPVVFRFRLALPRDVATPPDPFMTWVTRNRHFPSDLELVKCSVVNVPPMNDPLPLTTRDRSLLYSNELLIFFFPIQASFSLETSYLELEIFFQAMSW